MARRPLRGLAAVLVVLTLAACTGEDEGEEATASAPTASTTTSSTTSTTPAPATSPASTTPTSGVDEIEYEVGIPESEGPFPAVVVIHGGAWVTGGPELIQPLADYLTDSGLLTVNTEYTLANLDEPGFPAAVEDVACAVRFAAAHPDSDGTVAVVGHSSGAHLGALVALTGDEYEGECQIPGSGVPDRLVGLAGPYDVSRFGLLVSAFFGAGPEQRPEAWAAGNPQLLTDENTDLDSLIMYGELDGIVPDGFAIDFHNALLESGSESLLELVEGARHNDMHDPELVGDLIATWLARPGE
jgi:acetyl esterase/lipase